MDFKGKVIVVTGASSGIGAETAKYLAKLGGQLVIVGRNINKLKETGESIKTAGGLQTYEIQADVTNENDVKKIVNETIANFGRINVLVNNAGIFEKGSIEDTNLGQYDRLMNTNMRSIYQLTMLAVPYLILTKGCIVNVSSVIGMRSFPGVLAYNISKAAVDQFTRCVALEVAPKGVRCNSVDPGVIITGIHKRAGLDDEAYEKFLAHSREIHPLGRPGNVSEVASVIAFFASDAASFITGTNLPIDGGKHAMCAP